VFNQMVPVLRTAMEERRSGQYRDLSCTPLLLDETGWTNVIGAMDAQLTSLFEHQDDSRFRVAHTGEELIRVDVFMFGFEMPLPGSERVGPDLVMRAEPLGSIHERLSPAIADDMCRRIVKELNLRPMSAARSITPLGTSSTAPPIETSEGLRREPARDERRDGGVRVAQGRAKSALIMCVGAAQALSRSR
jgi:hypothetical protein